MSIDQAPRIEAEIAARQWGVVSRSQLLAAGVSPEAVRWRAAHHWRSLLPGVYSVQPGPIGLREAATAAQLYAGPSALVAGAAAARLHGLATVAPSGFIDLVVPMTGRTRTIGFARVTRSRIPEPDPHHLGALTLVSPGRAVAEALRRAPTEAAATELAIEAVQRRIVDVEVLTHWTTMLGRAGSARAQRALAAAATGAWSVPEHHLATLVRRLTTLPEPWLNPSLVDGAGRSLTSPDLWFDEVALAVMVHSRRYHATAEQWDETVSSDADLCAAGVVVLPVTPHQIATNADMVLARIRRAHLVAGRRPRPAVVAQLRVRGGVRWAG